MAERKKQSLFSGAFVLVVSTVIVKAVGLLYKIPLTALIGEVGRGYFSAAYNIFTPIYAISMAGLPVAVSRMVSRDCALGRYKQARKTFHSALGIFTLTGAAGTLLLWLLAYPYSFWFIRSPETLVSAAAIAPSVFFCCLMAAYRGYYEGLSNMTPTAVSQVIEAVAKMVLGLVFAYVVMQYGIEQFSSGQNVFGRAAADKAQALSFIYPYTAAAAICGVTAGTFIGWIYLALIHRIKGDGFSRTELVNSPLARKTKDTVSEMLRLSFPVVASSLILNITNLIDSVTVQNRLAAAVARDIDTVKQMYSAALSASGTLDKDIGIYLYGVYGAVMDFKMLIPTITMTLGISALPVISAAWAVKNKRSIQKTIASVFKSSMLIALPAGFGMAVLSEALLSVIYGSTRSRNLVEIASPILSFYGVFTPVMALSAPITNMLQAVGRTDVPVRSLFLGALVKIVVDYILVGEPTVNIYGAPIGSVVCYVIVAAYEMSALLKETGVKLPLMNIFIKPFICSVFSTAAAYFTHKKLTDLLPASGGVGTLICVLAAVFSACAVYGTLLLLTRTVSAEDISILPKGEKIVKALEKCRVLG